MFLAYTEYTAHVFVNSADKLFAGEDCSIRLWDIFAEDDSGDLLLGSHDGAAPWPKRNGAGMSGPVFGDIGAKLILQFIGNV